MDTNPPFATSADYAGLKDELQKIAAIVEKYPDQLKQRAFDLLINAYLGRSNVSETSAVATPETLAEASVPSGETPVTENEGAAAIETVSTSETFDEPTPFDPYASRSNTTSPLGVADETAAILLRKRIRLRTMSPVRWQTQSPV